MEGERPPLHLSGGVGEHHVVAYEDHGFRGRSVGALGSRGAPRRLLDLDGIARLQCLDRPAVGVEAQGGGRALGLYVALADVHVALVDDLVGHLIVGHFPGARLHRGRGLPVRGRLRLHP